MTKKYLVVYEKGFTSWGGFSPAVPGCGSTGETLDEMRIMLKEAIEGHFGSMAQDGDLLPEPTETVVDFSEETPANGIEYCIVEWLEVQIPQQAAFSGQQPALVGAAQEQAHHA